MCSTVRGRWSRLSRTPVLAKLVFTVCCCLSPQVPFVLPQTVSGVRIVAAPWKARQKHSSSSWNHLSTSLTRPSLLCRRQQIKRTRSKGQKVEGRFVDFTIQGTETTEAVKVCTCFQIPGETRQFLLLSGAGTFSWSCFGFIRTWIHLPQLFANCTCKDSNRQLPDTSTSIVHTNAPAPGRIQTLSLWGFLF